MGTVAHVPNLEVGTTVCPTYIRFERERACEVKQHPNSASPKNNSSGKTTNGETVKHSSNARRREGRGKRDRRAKSRFRPTQSCHVTKNGGRCEKAGQEIRTRQDNETQRNRQDTETNTNLNARPHHKTLKQKTLKRQKQGVWRKKRKTKLQFGGKKIY